MKTFKNINTSVDLIDEKVLGTLELVIFYPEQNKLIEAKLKTIDSSYKVKINSDNLAVFKCSIVIIDKKFVTNLLSFFTDLDEKYAERSKSVDDMMDLLK